MGLSRWWAGVLAVALAGLNLSAQTSSQDDDAALRRAGDILHIALPALAGGSAALKRDWAGLRQFTYSFGAMAGTVEILKRAYGKNRPDLGDSRSYPSGHTAFAFSGASFLWRRYGPKYGVPAVAAAGFVGVTRIKGKKHFADDVVAGAGIALIYNWLLVKPPGGAVRVKPAAVTGGGYGLTMEVDAGRRPDPDEPKPDPERERAFRIGFEFGAMDSRRLYWAAPPGGGTFLSVAPYELAVTPTARFEGDWRFHGPHEFNFVLAPFEARDYGGFPEEAFYFGGTEFSAGVRTEGRYRFNELLFRYRYRLVDTRRIDFRAGGSLAVRETLAGVVQEATEKRAHVSETEVTPLAHARLGIRLTKYFGLVGEIDGMFRSERQWSGGGLAAVEVRPAAQWDLLFGYRMLSRKHASDELFNHITFDYFGFGVGYSF